MNAGENRVPALVIADAVLMRLGSGPFRIALPSSPTTTLLQNPSGRMLGLLPTLWGEKVRF